MFSAANAQFKIVAEGPTFQEPEEGFAKILQMKNGNTMFIHVTLKKGINIRLYNAAHSEIATTSFETSYGKLRGGIDAVFEIAGDAVIMVADAESRTPMLFRIIVDGKTGNLKEDKKIGELSKISFFGGYAMVYGGVPMPSFFVRKDPYSDNYAVVNFNSFESDRSKRIEIVTYGSDNKETNRAYYASPDEKYKYLQYVDMAVLGSDKVCVLAYGYNTAHSGGKESELILANLDKGAKQVSFTELGFSKDFIVYQGVARFNPATKTLILAAVVKTKERDKGYIPMIAFVNPFEKKIDRFNTITPSDRVNKFSKDGFTGLPQDLYVNSDGTFTIVSEEMTITTSYGSHGGSSTSTFLDNVAVATYSKTGEFITDHLMRKSQRLDDTYLSPFYLSAREGTAQHLKRGNQFKSFAYFNGNDKSYILFNDTERNNDKQEGGSLVTVTGVSGSDGFYYPLKGTDVVPKRDYVFGNPAAKRDHNLGLFSISDYNQKDNLYITLELSKESGKKGVRVVWLQP